MPSTSKGDWIETYTGKAIYIQDPQPEDLSIIDIAWSLSLQCRYNGHTQRFYSVAEHCVLLSLALPEELALTGLLHDASEAYLTDLPRPLKRCLPDYATYENKLMQCIADAFDIEWPLPGLVKENVWENLGDPLPGITIEGWPHLEAYDRFLDRYHNLVNKPGTNQM
jgi:hypothetical protein